MHPFDIGLSLLIAAGEGSGLVFIGVLIQWSLRKGRPSAEPSVEHLDTAEAGAAPSQAEIAEKAPETVEPVVIAEPAEEPAPVVEAPPRAPVRIGLGLRKTRENFLGRIRAALTGSAKIDEIYEGLEEALIAADVGVEASMKIAAGVRAKLGNDARADVIRDALKAEIAAILAAA